MPAMASTGGLYALLDRSDAGHERAVSALEGLDGPLVLVAPVLTEGMRLAGRFLGLEAPDRLLESCLNGELLLQPLQTRDLSAVRGLLGETEGLAVSAALTLVVAERLGVPAVLCLEPEVRLAARRRGLRALPEEG